ncbi:protein FAM227A [Lissotriton helveticus]
MDSISRLASPMAMYQEDLQGNPLAQERLRESVRRSVLEPPAPFLIGSMITVNQKIAHLELQLKTCSNEDPAQGGQVNPSAPETRTEESAKDGECARRRLTAQAMTRERDRNELRTFAQKYERSMHKMDSSKYPLPKQVARKKLIALPKLVEIQRFPGFLEDGPTPLPNGTPLTIVLENVAAAFKRTQCKLCSTKGLLKFLNTPAVEHIVLNSFWWIFLNKYQPDHKSQTLLFDRVADSYMNLILHGHKGHIWDTFMRNFPPLMSQAVYSCFCLSFPDSSRQFRSDDFRTLICNTLWEWIAGHQPFLDISNTWDFSSLERKKKEAEDKTTQNEKEGKDSSISLLRLDPTGTSVSSRISSVRRHKLKCVPLPLMPCNCSLSHDLKQSKDSSNRTSSKSDLSNEERGVSSSSNMPATVQKPLQLKTDKGALLKEAAPSQPQLFEMRSVLVTKESHPACPGPDFMHNLFNLEGHSPLVQHYLQQRDAQQSTGHDRLIKWTAIQKPMSHSAETYASVIRRGFRRLQQSDIMIQALYRKRFRESAAFSRRQLETKKDFLRKEHLIMSKKNEMKRLSQLVFPVSKNADGGIPQEVAEALDAALAAQN